MTALLGVAQVDSADAACWAASRGAPAWWCRLADLYWRLAPGTGVRADVAWAQACKETGFGRFGRAVTPEHHNPAGLKIPDPTGLADSDPNAHARFPRWDIGILGHLQKLANYGGAPGYPLAYTRLSATRWSGATCDPRHFGYLWGTATSVEDLGGEDPSDGIPDYNANPDYGISIVRDLLNPMIAYAAVPTP